MSRCELCKKKKHILTIDCKYCRHLFCSYCILPEIHACDKILEVKATAQLRLNESLENYKCIKDKVNYRI